MLTELWERVAEEEGLKSRMDAYTQSSAEAPCLFKSISLLYFNKSFSDKKESLKLLPFYHVVP